jgi:two-component system, chemotaxis family, sensor kinase CheA
MKPAEVNVEAIAQSFLVESEEALDRMETALVVLEGRPSDSEAVNDIFRHAHTIKGNAASLGFSAVTALAHALEDLLERLRAGSLGVSCGLVTTLLKAVDALRQMIPAAVAGNDELLPGQQSLLETLRAAAPTSVTLPPAVERRSPGRRRSDIQSLVENRRTLRVDTERLNRMLDLTGEVAIARDRLRGVVGEAAREGLSEAFQNLDRLLIDLQELVLKARMVPVGPIFQQFSRLVRDVAVAQGKQARLAIEGEAVEIDSNVVEQLKDPLTHMIRNALDHGLESPADRTAAGKDPCGTITLCARHESGSIIIEVGDDGAGLARDRVQALARTNGRLGEGLSLTEKQIADLICEPGFSTASSITALSGRGVGLDIVRRRVQSLRGELGFASTAGHGTRVIIRVPLTLAIIDGFAVKVGDETYVVPLDSVVECVDRPPDATQSSRDRGVIDLRDRPLPYLRLRSHLELGEGTGEREQIVVVRHGTGLAGLAVDAIIGASQAVVKPLGNLIDHQPGIAGCTVLGSGRVALILDIPALFRSIPDLAQSSLDARTPDAAIRTL